uniref:DAPG hydrolase PhiG domain-containing protein n=2 Tax=unclassified Mycobacterium TaxID=2642494 RepID=A0A5Q5BJI3_MYCSS
MSSMSRPVLYPLRAVDTATVEIIDAAHHRRRVTIDHRPLDGVTPAMLLDWFTHLDGTVLYGDEVIDRYLAWHPIDHIRWELARPAPGGGAADGAWFRMVEAFGGRPEFTIDEVARVEKLDATGIRLVKRVAGVVVFQLEHTWSAGKDGAHYVTVMDLGARSALFAPVNRLVTRHFPDDKMRAWVRHNIEEVGQLEYLLPALVSGEAEPAQRAQRRHTAPRGEDGQPQPVDRQRHRLG